MLTIAKEQCISVIEIILSHRTSWRYTIFFSKTQTKKRKMGLKYLYNQKVEWPLFMFVLHWCSFTYALICSFHFISILFRVICNAHAPLFVFVCVSVLFCVFQTLNNLMAVVVVVVVVLFDWLFVYTIKSRYPTNDGWNFGGNIRF